MLVEASDGIFKLSVSAVLFILKTLTFSFIFVRRLFSKNQRINSTKKRTPAIATQKQQGKCCLKPLIPYMGLLFPPFFSFVHFLLTLIFIDFRRLLFSFSLFLYYDNSFACIYRTLQNITTQQYH